MEKVGKGKPLPLHSNLVAWFSVAFVGLGSNTVTTGGPKSKKKKNNNIRRRTKTTTTTTQQKQQQEEYIKC